MGYPRGVLWIHREPTNTNGTRAARGARSIVLELSDEQLGDVDQRELRELLASGLKSGLYVVGSGSTEQAFDPSRLDEQTAALKASYTRFKSVHGQLLETLETVSILEQRVAEAEHLAGLSEEEEEEADDGENKLLKTLVWILFKQLEEGQGVTFEPEMRAQIMDLFGL